MATTPPIEALARLGRRARQGALRGALMGACVLATGALGCDHRARPDQAATCDPDRASATNGASQAAVATAPWTYNLAIEHPTTQFIQLRVDVPAGPDVARRFAMPAWTPGSYLIRDFARHVYAVEAHTADGAPLRVRKLDKQTWEVTGHEGAAFSLAYRVFADELSVRTSFVDDRLALLNGASLFMYEPGATDRAATVAVSLPEAWRSVATLDPVADGTAGRYAARSYDELVDSPWLLGQSEVQSFEVGNARFDYAFAATSETRADLDHLVRDAEKIVRAFHGLLGDFPFERYVFLTVADEAGGGGLEHARACAMILRPRLFQRDDAYHRAANLLAHEFFHLWNVKRIRDERLGPFDYSREVYSDLLWFHEGFTETMEGKALVWAGLVDEVARLQEITANWNSYAGRPGRNYAPISQLSRDAWIKAYQPSPAHWNTSISYYQKGNILGLALDAELRARGAASGTNGSLEGLFADLWSGRDPNTHDRPITADDIVAAASKQAGEDMRWFFDRHVDGTEEVDLPGALERLGVIVTSFESTGAYAGLSGRARAITRIDAGSPAETAGLMIGDDVVSVDGKKIDDVNAIAKLADPGTTLHITVMRRGRKLVRPLELAPPTGKTWMFDLPEHPSPALQAFLGTTPP